MEIKNGKLLTIYISILSLLYAATGILEIISALLNLIIGIGLSWIPPDLFGGFSALVISAIFFKAIFPWRRRKKANPYLLGATLMSMIFGTLYILIFIATGIDAYIVNEEWKWITDLMRPEIWLAAASTPLTYMAWIKMLKEFKGKVN
ncbi:MAG: hypothetical protein NDF53_04975 [archaeon GB-1867-097]|nr:hypothetical protein [Candidatus Culexmicrobium thermophilum]MCS7385066.1 hypothetical protein [Candidatus Culexmicrobium thermophilum]HDO20981.1 hypothetical protein [Candidatus Bathyarchaeota archaeon]